jgi:wobble nucleotide-excising tRNase
MGVYVITGIAKIKGLGVYDNYTKPTGIKEFGVKNLIYGWNYSGKTTLSRLFAQLENKAINSDLAGCSFTIETDSSSITEKNFTETNLSVRVFNSDFIRDNLNFSGQSFKPILLLGKDTEQAQKSLDHCVELNTRARKLIEDYTKKIKELNSASSNARTKAAANIKKTLGIVEIYTAIQLTSDVKAVSILNDSLLDQDNLRDSLKLALTSDSEKPLTVTSLNVSTNLVSINEDAVKFLGVIPSLTNTIKHLEQNSSIEKWIEQGLPLHSNKVSCEFCGGELTDHRVEELHAHFSKDLAEHKKRVEGLYGQAKAAVLSIALPKEVEFNSPFRDKYSNAARMLPTALDKFNSLVDSLVTNIQAKIDNPFKVITVADLDKNYFSEINTQVGCINDVISENNALSINFAKEKAAAKSRVKNHYVQEYIDDRNAVGNDEVVSRLNSCKDRIIRFLTSVESESIKLKAIISKAQLGREAINERLVSLLGSEAVQIKVIPDSGQDRFQLVRITGAPARNLSDGEKTAIAFSYFLTKLQELKPDEFKNTIVYIDDPISSLDANHIFQITAGIRDFFLHQVANGSNLEWTTKCMQLFVSTHNFEFFHLLREMKPDNQNKAPLFLIKRKSSSSSVLVNMPISLSKYSSEYHFLFDIIHRYHKNPDKTDHEVLMLLPNAVRRFIELYTYSRLPGQYKDTVDQRAALLFGNEKAKRILKVFHYFSHANSIERLAGNNELIFDVENAVKDLFSSIQGNDPHHWSALLDAIETT